MARDVMAAASSDQERESDNFARLESHLAKKAKSDERDEK